MTKIEEFETRSILYKQQKNPIHFVHNISPKYRFLSTPILFEVIPQKKSPRCARGFLLDQKGGIGPSDRRGSAVRVAPPKDAIQIIGHDTGTNPDAQTELK